MTNKEMHTSFNLLLQKAASQQYTQFTPDQIDTLLNSGQDILLKDILTNYANRPVLRGTQNNSISIDDIRTLQVKNHKINAIVPQEGSDGTGFIYEPNMVFGVLPRNYQHIINVRNIVKYFPNFENECVELSGRDKNCASNNYTEYIAVVPFIAPVDTYCQNNRITLKIVFKGALKPDGTYGDLTIFDYDNFSSANGYSAKQGIAVESDKYVFLNPMLEFMNRFNSSTELIPIAGIPIESDNDFQNYYDVYWENYRSSHYPNCFIFVARGKTDVSIQGTSSAYETDSSYNTGNKGVMVSILGNGNSVLKEQRFKQVSYCHEYLVGYDATDSDNPTPNTASKISTSWVEGKLTQPKLVYSVLSDGVQNKFAYKRPVNSISNNYIVAYTAGGFTVDKFIIDYYKVPRRINLRYQSNCEFPPHVHHVIVQRAVDLALEAIQSQRVQIRESKPPII